MRTLLITLGCLVFWSPLSSAQVADPAVKKPLEAVYHQWRESIVRKDYRRWQSVTARSRQISVRNRIHSERRPFPASVFNVPVTPPSLAGLRALRVEARGLAAKAVYFGKIDFKVPGEPPTDNLLVLNFVRDAAGWKYDEAEYVNLSGLPEVRKQLQSGDLSYVKAAEFAPSAKPAVESFELKAPVKYIAKVYVYAPGREVEAMVNKLSRHKFQNTKASEVVIGGARDGRNEVQFGIKGLPGGTGKEPMTIRVYLMSEVPGVQPVKVFEYLVPEGGQVKPYATQQFMVGPKEIGRLQGR